ncbi:MAG: hypothetical protein WCK91_02195 [bacterium]
MTRIIKKYKVIVSVIVLIFILIFVIYFQKNTSSQDFKQDDSSGVELSSLVGEVGKLVYLPASETPKMVTVSDPKALSGQSFFDGAQSGDKILFYDKSKRAILYDPVGKKIRNMGKFDISAGSL